MNKDNLREEISKLPIIDPYDSTVGEVIGKENLDKIMQKFTQALEGEKIKAFDDGYDAGRKEKPPRLFDAIDFRREQYGWTDAKMAAMLDLSPAHYSEFKNGKRGFPVNSIRKAYAIGIPASVLLQDDIDRQLRQSERSNERT